MGNLDMPFAHGLVVPHLRRSIDASRAAAMQLFAATTSADGVQDNELTHVPLADQAVAGLLRLLEKDLGVRARFVPEAGDATSARALPDQDGESFGAGAGAPVRLASGRVYGMLCFFRRDREGQLDERDVRRLQMSARLAARLIDGADVHGIPC